MTRRSNHGFTLLELLIVVSIIGVLAIIALPAFWQYKAKAFDSRSLADLRSAASSEEAYFSDTEHYVDCIGAVCEAALPGYKGSGEVDLAMYEVPASGGVAEHFTGRAYHPRGTRKSLLRAYTWNSVAGGLQ